MSLSVPTLRAYIHRALVFTIDKLLAILDHNSILHNCYSQAMECVFIGPLDRLLLLTT